MIFLIIMFKWVEKYLASKENLINDMMHIQFTQHFFFTNSFAILLFELKRKWIIYILLIKIFFVFFDQVLRSWPEKNLILENIRIQQNPEPQLIFNLQRNFFFSINVAFSFLYSKDLKKIFWTPKSEVERTGKPYVKE